MKKIAIIVAAGSGTRMESATPKQFLKIEGKPVLWYTLKAFYEAFSDLEIILVLPKDALAAGEEIAATFSPARPIHVISGGNTRFQSVKNGLAYVQEAAIVFIHDGVRCLITPALIQRCYEEALKKGNAIPAVGATDSLRIIDGQTNRSLDRNQVQVIQTPQTFHSADILAAFGQPYKAIFTDEASVIEAAGSEVHLITGESTNLKITKPIDLILATEIMKQRQVGYGRIIS